MYLVKIGHFTEITQEKVVKSVEKNIVRHYSFVVFYQLFCFPKPLLV